jgi:PilZ domain
MNPSTSEKSHTNDRSHPAIHRQEVRCAVRFPLSLPVELSAGKSDVPAMTQNVSANGVLFTLNAPLSVGQGISFSLRMPGTALGAAHDVLVHCSGRVVRCSINHEQYQAAATIDEYRFVGH